MYYCLSKAEGFFTQWRSSEKCVMYPAGKLIALPLRWVHKGMMFWVKSQKRVNIFRKSKILMFLHRKMMNRKDPKLCGFKGMFLPMSVVLDQAWNTWSEWVVLAPKHKWLSRTMTNPLERIEIFLIIHIESILGVQDYCTWLHTRLLHLIKFIQVYGYSLRKILCLLESSPTASRSSPHWGDVSGKSQQEESLTSSSRTHESVLLQPYVHCWVTNLTLSYWQLFFSTASPFPF